MPTRAGWAVIVAVPLLCCVMVVTLAVPVLQKNDPIGRGGLVVEGWMSRQEMADCAALFRAGNYDEVYVTGGPIHGESYLRQLYPDHPTEAEVGANQLRQFGIAPVYAVPRGKVAKDRTYSSALALRKWLVDTGRAGAELDIVSSGPHSRRSWMLFRLALGDDAQVGVIATEPRGYDPGRWWATSSGVRAVIGEMIAYGYAKFLFYPNPEADLERLNREAN